MKKRQLDGWANVHFHARCMHTHAGKHMKRKGNSCWSFAVGQRSALKPSKSLQTSGEQLSSWQSSDGQLLCAPFAYIFTLPGGALDLLICLWMITGAGVLCIAFICGGVTVACRICFCSLLLTVCTHHFLCCPIIIVSRAVTCVMSVDHC